MPNTSSAKNALRQSIRRRARNVERERKLKDILKKFKKLAAAGNKDEIQAFLPKVYAALDKMAKVKFIKRGKANRLKSRLSKRVPR